MSPTLQVLFVTKVKMYRNRSEKKVRIRRKVFCSHCYSEYTANISHQLLTSCAFFSSGYQKSFQEKMMGFPCFAAQKERNPKKLLLLYVRTLTVVTKVKGDSQLFFSNLLLENWNWSTNLYWTSSSTNYV